LSTPPEGVGRFSAEQRSEVRYRVEQPAMMRVLGAHVDVFLVTILDASRSGLRVSCPKGFAVGTQVEVSFAALKLPGQVRYVRLVEAGTSHLGIQVAAGRESELLRRLKLPA
jgi:hypothetical protein